MKFAFGIALFAVSTEATFTTFQIPPATECRTIQCIAVETLPSVVGTTNLDSCLESAPTSCVYTATYKVAAVSPLKSCTTSSMWAGGASAVDVHGYDLSALAPIAQGTLKTVTGSLAISLTAAATAETCTAKYLVTPVNTTTATCTAAATSGGTEVSYATNVQTITLPLTTALFPATSPIGTNLQIGSKTYAGCGTSYGAASLTAVEYTMDYQGRASTSGALSVMALGVLPALYFMF